MKIQSILHLALITAITVVIVIQTKINYTANAETLITLSYISKNVDVFIEQQRSLNDLKEENEKLKRENNRLISCLSDEPKENNRDLSEDVFWMAYCIYFEARNQPRSGKEMVGHVLLNRVKSYKFPDTIREVLFQDNQFSFIWDKRIDKVTDSDKSWNECIDVAKDILSGKVSDKSKGSLYFHASKKKPYKNSVLIARIGNHSFYK